MSSQHIGIFEFSKRKIMCPNEPHLACVLLLDTSGSMSSNGGAPIASLNKAIRAFKEQIGNDEVAQRRIDIAIVEFNSVVRVAQNFVPLPMFEPEEFCGSGLTAMGEGINIAIDILKERMRFYKEIGTLCFIPWIFMITDGETTDDLSTARERIYLEDQNNKLKFWALGVNGYNKETLLSLTQRSMELELANFSKILEWLSNSLIVISKSSIDDKVILPELPEDTHLLETGW